MTEEKISILKKRARRHHANIETIFKATVVFLIKERGNQGSYSRQGWLNALMVARDVSERCASKWLKRLKANKYIKSAGVRFYKITEKGKEILYGGRNNE